MIAEYGAEQAPPPWQIFTIPNNIQEGNLHFVQKVFEGAFEVIALQLHQTNVVLTITDSLTSCILPLLRRSPSLVSWSHVFDDSPLTTCSENPF